MLIRLIKNYSYTLSFLWATFIFLLCATPGSYIPSANWLELLSFDKLVHAGVFFVLMSLLGISVHVHQQNRSTYYLFFMACILYGGLLEIMQATVFSERSADWLDAIANGFGCLVAWLMRKKIIFLIFK